jgi:uncharacterized membrane protein
MGLFTSPIPVLIAYIALLLALGALIKSVINARWKLLQAPTVLSAWCACIILLTMVWRFRINVSSDLSLHLLGLSLLPLMFGRALATLGLSLTVIAYTALFNGLWSNLGLNLLLLAIMPAWLSDLILRATQRFLPHHLFVYLFGNGFFGSMAVLSLSGLCSMAAHMLWTRPSGPTSDAIAYMLLLAWGETFVVGFLVTIFAVYRPNWLLTFDDRIYLRGR